HAKRDRVPVDPGAVLDGVTALPIETWSYLEDPTGTRHLGPMAQDFAATFGLGDDETRIYTIDGQGVALAAIQGLTQKVEDASAALRAENAELRRRLAALEQVLAELRAAR